jgi:hypothetical protein
MALATIRSRLSGLARELRAGYPLWMFVGGLGVAFAGGAGIATAVGVASGRDGSPADVIRCAGTLLTVFGLVLVAYGLNETRSVFGKESMTTQAIAWGKRVVASLSRRNVVIGVGSAHLALSGVAATARVEAMLSDTSVEGRLAWLEQQVRSLRQQADADREALRGELATVRASFTSESEQTRNRVTDVEGRLDRLAVGGLVLEWIGLWWLLLGTVAANLNTELANLLP